MYLNFQTRRREFDNFMITSGDSYLKLDVAGLTRNALNASVNAKWI